MVKTTKEFIRQFRLNEENFEFNREDFLTELNKYFLEILYKAISNNTELQNPYQSLISYANSGKFTWDMFKHAVKQVEQKFWAISNKKVGLPFSKKLWGAFYVKYVIKVRSDLFPKIEKEIRIKRERYEKEKILKQQD